MLLSRLGLQNTTIAYLRRRKPPPNECPSYDSKQSDSEVPTMLQLWRMYNAPSLSSLPGQLLLGVVAPDRIQSMGEIELNCELMLN